MTVQQRDKRALVGLGVVLAIALIYWLASGSSSGGSAKVVAAGGERRQGRKANRRPARSAMTTLDGKEAVLKQVSAELAEREKGLIPGDTAEQAQAQLLQIMRRLAKAQSPPIDLRQSELGQPRSYGDSYARVTVSVIDGLPHRRAAESAGGAERATGDHRHRRDPLRRRESEIEIHAGAADRFRPGAAAPGSAEEKGMPAL